ncbi:MAG: hypothetical protein ACRDZX_18070 [Acidimicrobiales bacterium]
MSSSPRPGAVAAPEGRGAVVGGGSAPLAAAPRATADQAAVPPAPAHVLSSRWRYQAGAALAVIAGVRAALAPEHLHEAPYVGALFIALTAGCVLLGATLAVADRPAVWAAAGLVMLAAASAYVLSRSVGLPEIGDDTGNWLGPLGVVSLAAEAVTLTLAALALGRRRLEALLKWGIRQFRDYQALPTQIPEQPL